MLYLRLLMASKKYICNCAKGCAQPCDSTDPHNVPHEQTNYCRKAECKLTGKIVECEEINDAY